MGGTRSGRATAPTTSTHDLLKTLVLRGNVLESEACAVGTSHDLSADEWLILDSLTTADGLSMSDVSAQTLSSGASLTRAVDRLVSRSLVYRTPSLTDRRRVEVRISDLGRRLHAAMSAELSEVESQLRSALHDAGVDPDAVTSALAGFTASATA